MNLDFQQILERPFALIINNTSAENDVHIYYGKVLKKENNYIFTNDSKDFEVEIISEYLKRIQLITDENRINMSFLYDSEFLLWLEMEDIETISEGMRKTGINWNFNNEQLITNNQKWQITTNLAKLQKN